MIRNGEITAVEVTRILRRYWWIPVLMTTLLASAAYLATLVLPKKYTSSTRVLVEQPTVPTEFVKPVVTDDLNHRLASMQEQIFAPNDVADDRAVSIDADSGTLEIKRAWILRFLETTLRSGFTGE